MTVVKPIKLKMNDNKTTSYTILFLLRFFPLYGGGESVTIRLANEFCKYGDSVTIAYLWDKGWEKISLSDEIKTVKLSNTYPVNKEDISKGDRKKIENSLNELLNNTKFDIIINQWLPPKMVWKANNTNAKIIACKHSAVYIKSKKWDLLAKFPQVFRYYILRKHYWEYLKYSDKYVLLCRVYADEINKIFNEKARGKVSWINNPCMYDLPVNFNIEDKENIVLFVGRLYDAKRVDMLLKVWGNLERKIPKVVLKWKLFIVGSGSSKEQLVFLSKELNLKNVFFEGFQNPEKYYKKSKILVSASQTEGYPMSIVEGMAYGCVPVVMNSYSALNDLLNDQIGFSVEDKNIEKFSSTLAYLFENPDALCEKAANCIKYIARFDIKDISRAWHKLFFTLLY